MTRKLLSFLAAVVVSVNLNVVVVIGVGVGVGVGVGFSSSVYAADCVIDNNLSDTVETFVGKCVKGSVGSVMPGSMWSKTVGDVKNNRSKDDDYKTAWKLISRSEYRK